MSLQRFSWSFQEVPHLVVLRYETARTCQGVGDDAGALLASLYADHVKSFTNFEVAGVKFALLSLVRFNLEGHGANKATVAEKERMLNPKVFLSKRYCGNHATGLCEARMYSAADEKTHWMVFAM